MAIRTFSQVNGRWTIPKDPDSKLFYFGNITDWLLDSGSTIASVVAMPVGVTVTADSTGFTGAIVRSRVEGLDVTNEESVNSLTWRVTLVDSQTEDFTIYFSRGDN
jgi:hypothetical protein